MDGKSTDSTMEMMSRWPDSIIHSEPDNGMYDALAKGLRKSTGDIVGYLNAGDILFPWAFDVLLNVFENSEVNWCTGYTSQINCKGQITAAWAPPRYRREFVLNGYYASPSYPHGIQQESTFWRRSLNGHIDYEGLAAFRIAGDYYLWTQFAKHQELHSVMSQLGAFLIHPGQLSEQQDRYEEEVKSCIRPATGKEKFTAWWETRCNTLLRGPLWNLTLKKSAAKIIGYDHGEQRWVAR